MKFWAKHPVLLGVCILFGVGMFGAYWQAVLFILAVLAVAFGVCRWMVWLDRRSHQQITRRRGLVHRADYEHWLWMQGDQRGVFGQYPPA